MNDLDTILFLEQFKVDYLDKMKKIHESNRLKFATMNDKETIAARDIEDKVNFLSSFVASIEGTLEQNAVLKVTIKNDSKLV